MKGGFVKVHKREKRQNLSQVRLQCIRKQSWVSARRSSLDDIDVEVYVHIT